MNLIAFSDSANANTSNIAPRVSKQMCVEKAALHGSMPGTDKTGLCLLVLHWIGVHNVSFINPDMSPASSPD